MKVSADKLIASVCRDSFFEFCKEFWSVIIQQKPVWNFHIPFLCDEMQQAAERVMRDETKLHDYIINVPPGSTKSTICSVMFPAWVLTRMPHARTICGSHTDQLVLDLSNKSRHIVQSERFQQLFPHIRIREDQNTKGYWMTEQGGFRFSCTVGGKNPMGFHGHFLIVDDPIDPQKVMSELEIKAANDWMTNVISSRKVDARVSVLFLIMQRLHQDDPTGNRLSNPAAGAVRYICLPAEDAENVKPAYLRKKYQDGLLDPVRLPRHVLTEKLALMGEFGYSGQFRQHPVPIGGGMFKTDRINFAPAPAKFKKVCRYWDKAGTKDGGAFTVGVKMGRDMQDNYWVLDVVRGQWESFKRETIMAQTAKLDGRSVIIGLEQEPGSGGKESAENSTRRLAGYRVRADRPTGDKVVRADTFSVQVNAGNVYMDDRCGWVQTYLDELTYFPFSKYKDQVDASSGAFAELARAKLMLGAL